MAEFKLGRIRFVWQDAWTTGTTYYKDDVVKFGGRVYICVAGHAAAADFYSDLNAVPTKWNQLSDGQSWKGVWAPSTTYKINDIVKYGARLYVCNLSHTSSTFVNPTYLGLEQDQSKWDILSDGLDWKGDWAVSTRYKVHDIVKYGGYTYVCNTAHISSAGTATGLEADQSKWDAFNQGVQFKGTWTPSTRYKANDVVKYGSDLWICTTPYTSTSVFASDVGNWAIFVEGLQFESTWNSGAVYQPGDIVQYGGFQYVAKTNHTNAVPSTSTTQWGLFSRGFKLAGDYNGATAYKVGEVVKLNGYTYMCIADTTGNEPPNLTYWERLNSGFQWLGAWTSTTEYKQGDVVRYLGNAWVCILAHTAATGNRPDNDLTYTYWNIFTTGSETNVLTTLGDTAYYGVGGPTRLPVGKEGQILRVTADAIPEWSYLGVVEDIYYVSPNGTDLPAPTWGRTLDKPWKTIRYACEQVDKGPKYANVQALLFNNRQFIQREVVCWINKQIQTNTSPFTTGFVYDDVKCERDIGYMIDRLSWDLGHGGNVKCREAALSYVTGQYTKLAAQSSQDVAAYNYMVTLIGNVLANTAPATNYQTAVGDQSTAVVAQYFDATLVAEAGATTRISSLVKIVTDALTAGTSTGIPDKEFSNVTIMVKTGTYNEVLPIIVPGETAILGDENRSVTVRPQGSVVSKTDAPYSYAALTRLESVVSDIVLGNTVTKSAGNSATQVKNFPFGEAIEANAVKKSVRTIQQKIAHGLNHMYGMVRTDPTGYASGYSNARTLIEANKEFFRAEIIAYITANYPALNGYYSKTKCKRDVEYIIDAISYDLTYGGTYMSYQAGLSYFAGTGGAFQIGSDEKTATLAAYDYLKALVSLTAQSSAVTPLQTTVPQVTGTAGSLAAANALAASLDIIIGIINNGTSNGVPNATVTTIASGTTFTTSSAHGLSVGDVVIPQTTANGLVAGTYYWVKTVPLTTTFTLAASYGGSEITTFTNGTGLTLKVTKITYGSTSWVNAGLPTAYTALSAAVSSIKTLSTDFVQTNFGGYNGTLCRRDAGYLVDAAYYDVAFGTNYNAVTSGRSYLRRQASTVIASQKAAEIGALGYLRDQAATYLASDSTSVTRSNAAFTEMIDIVTNGTASADALVFTDTGVSNDTVSRTELVNNRAFIITTLSSWIQTNYASLWTSLGTTGQTTCQRDIGYAVDALSYDVQYGGNTATRTFCYSLFNNITGASVQPADQQTASAATYTQLGVIAAQIVRGTYAGQNTSAGDGGATNATRMTTLAGNIASVVTAGNLSGLVAESLPSTTWAATGIKTAIATLAAAKTTVVRGTVQYVNTNFSNLPYNIDKCERDIGLVLEAMAYDFMFGSNIATYKAAWSYMRTDAAAVVGAQKTATLAMWEFVKLQAKNNVGGNATVQSSLDNLFKLLDDVVFGSAAEGSNRAIEANNAYSAIRQLQQNKEFIVAEIAAYIAATYPSYTYVINTCKRDVRTFIDAICWDLTYPKQFKREYTDGVTLYYPSNYKSLLAARYYVNAVTGSYEEDMYYLRNSTGVRNQTMTGLNGDLTPANAYGTRRVTAGAVVSLDPGWGADDDRTWITTRSPFIQNCATFGNAGIGLKIDGNVHNGGNKSMVANDFTQLISDGIGAWVTNNARAELVSVFTYYSYIGYLSENGGRIRGTNGNNSYGRFGSVAEGVDATEVPNTAVVDNTQYQASIGKLVTSGSVLQAYEYDNAGSNYTYATSSLFGAGVSGNVVHDDFRDDGVFNVRLTQLAESGDGQLGGSNYMTIANTCQSGDAVSITIAATDSALSTAYQDMKIVLDGGVGAGQYGLISNFNSGTKVAQVVKPNWIPVAVNSVTGSGAIITVASTANIYVGMPVYFTGTSIGSVSLTTPYYVIAANFGATTFSVSTTPGGSAVGTFTDSSTAGMYVRAAGWEHMIAGNAISNPDASTTYTIEPAVEFTLPGFTSTARTLPSSSPWVWTSYDETRAVYTPVATTSSGAGAGATFGVIRKGTAYTVTLVSGGTGYVRLETITIPGTSLGGTSANNITLTVTNVNSTTGAVRAWDVSGYGVGGKFIAIASDRSTGYSNNGTTWAVGGQLPTGTWVQSVSGYLTETPVAGGSFVAGRSYVIVELGSTNWTTAGLPSGLTAAVGLPFIAATSGSGSGTAYPVTNVTVAISSGTATANSYDDGISWGSGGTLPASGFSSVAFGNGRWVAIQSGGTSTAYSVDGGASWTAGGALPSSTTWSSVVYGKGVWVAIASGGTAAASSTDNGLTWVARTLPSSSGWTSVAYGNNRFVAISGTAASTVCAYSLDGLTWTAPSAGLPTSATWTSVKYGQGVFLAVSTTTAAATSEDGIYWTARTMSTAANGFSRATFGNINQSGIWVGVQRSTAGTVASSVVTGARAKARAQVTSYQVTSIRITDPGSGYTSTPTMTLTDPNKVYAAPFTVRVGKGALANPSFVNRGSGYVSATATIVGDGYADYYQSGSYVAVRRLTSRPVPGSNVVFASQPNTIYKLVSVTSFTGSYDGSYKAFFKISPTMSVANAPDNGTTVTTRLKYSQVRLTGHDFLNVGTGGVTTTNYPDTPVVDPDQTTETVESGGGRVFYTSTDQDGNFRVGDLFTIEQSTGVATLNADAFNLAGLQELTLGTVQLGGNSAAITEFSTDPFFTADSDSIVPTQRAIKAYISSQIGGGGASLIVNTLTAGSIFLSGNTISSTDGSSINVTAVLEFKKGITGVPLAMNFFLS